MGLLLVGRNRSFLGVFGSCRRGYLAVLSSELQERERDAGTRQLADRGMWPLFTGHSHWTI